MPNAGRADECNVDPGGDDPAAAYSPQTEHLTDPYVWAADDFLRNRDLRSRRERGGSDASLQTHFTGRYFAGWRRCWLRPTPISTARAQDRALFTAGFRASLMASRKKVRQPPRSCVFSGRTLPRSSTAISLFVFPQARRCTHLVGGPGLTGK